MSTDIGKNIEETTYKLYENNSSNSNILGRNNHSTST